MLKIRLQRVGRKNNPSFRVVCTDSKKGPKSHNNIEILGSYDPKQNHIAIKNDRVEHWISQGAQVSDTVHNLLVKEGVIKGKKVHVSRGEKNTRTPEAEEVKEVPAEEDEKEKEAVENINTSETENSEPKEEIKSETEESKPEESKKEEVVEEKKEEVV